MDQAVLFLLELLLLNGIIEIRQLQAIEQLLQLLPLLFQALGFLLMQLERSRSLTPNAPTAANLLSSASRSSPPSRSSQRRCCPGRESCWVCPCMVRSINGGRSSSSSWRFTATPLILERLLYRSSCRRHSRLTSRSSSSTSRPACSIQSFSPAFIAKLASMRARSHRLRSNRTPNAPWAPPRRASSASRRMDFPAPVSPVSTVKPASKFSSRLSISAMFWSCRPMSTARTGDRLDRSGGSIRLEGVSF